jgi:error-prone DNA polymerase
VTPEKVGQYVPVEISAQGVPLIQWEKDGTEAMGLVKIDLLGNRSLAVIRDTLKAIEENHGIKLPYGQFNPIHDEKTQALIRSGQTMGVFYVESPAMRRLLIMVGKGDYDHLVVLSSIIRPAANKFINEYVRRVRGGTWEPLHPRIEHTLSETLGVMVYQEDVARVAVEAAGFSEAEADIFRRILAKSPRKVAGQQERFYRGALQNGIPLTVINELWEMIVSFSGYSFCKPHSASYALVSFKSAYLKVHFPAEFMAAVISNGGGYYAPRAYLSEAERMGLTILPPGVNESNEEYTGKGKTIRVGLCQIKGLSRKCVERILEERDKSRFRDFTDVMNRVKPNLGDSLLLLKVGALDSLGRDFGRKGMAWWIRANLNASEKSLVEKRINDFPRGDLPPEVKLAQEVEALGFPVSCHPISLFQEAIDRMNPKPVPAKELPHHVGKQVRVVGFPITEKHAYTHKGEPMEFLSLEDLTDIFEATLFPAAYKKFCQQITFSRPFLLQGRVEEEFGALSLTVSSLTPLASKAEGRV